MAFQKGGYGTYQRPKEWSFVYRDPVNGNIITVTERPIRRPGPASAPRWRSPNYRGGNRGIYSGAPVIDLVKKPNGSYGLPKKMPKLKGLGRLGPYGWMLDKLLNDTSPWWMQPDPGATEPWYSPAFEPWCPSGVANQCYGRPQPTHIISDGTFCLRTSAPPMAWFNGYRYGWKQISRCDTGTSAWQIFWRTRQQWAAGTFPWYPRIYGEAPHPRVDPQVFPEAQPIGGMMPHATSRPIWATPQRHPNAVVGREAGYSSPDPTPEAPPPLPPTIFPPHYREPPRLREHETKKRMPLWLMRAMRWALVGTEVRDAIQAIAEGMGWRGREDGGLVTFIYRNWHKVTDAQMQQIVFNLVYNHIEDEIIGRLQGGTFTINGVTFRRMGNGWINARF